MTWELNEFSSVSLPYFTLCNPMDCSTPGSPVHYQLPGLAQTHVHRVSDAIQPSHPVSSPSPPDSVFSSIRVFSNESVLHKVAKVLELQLQHQYFQWIFRTESLRTDWLDQESSPTPQFKSINSSALSFIYDPNLSSIHDCWKNHSFD